MKKTILLLITLLVTITGFSQKKESPKPPEVPSISKNDKWVENFSLKKEKFKVFCGYQPPSKYMDQKNNDTLVQYKIAFYKNTYSLLEITKLATKNGKIIREGYYTVKNDTLTVITDYYDYYHTGRITDIYVLDKYGFLKKISDKMSIIKTDSLSDRYLKPIKFEAPPLPAKN